MGVQRLVWAILLHACITGYGVTEGLAINWGTRASHQLPADITVRLLKDNGFNKVKLFEADPFALQALGKSGIEVMLGIPNEFLVPLSSSVQVAEDWVKQNVSTYISKYGVDIRYVAVGNEPFLAAYNGTYEKTTLPALQNIQAAIIKAGLGRQVKVTVPLNADVYESASDLPSGADFRPDIHSLMISIIKSLIQNGGPLTINIYPFLSLNMDPNFPIEFAFFNGTAAPVIDGSIAYTNVFDANYDTLIWALEKNNFSSVPVIVGEVGWPTDGDRNANVDYARRFNQGLINRIIRNQGTPKRPTPPEVYFFGLLDEDIKSIQPGNFERHWGMFYFDGSIKYPLNLDKGKRLVPANGVKYLAKQWCVLSPDASALNSNLPESVNYACTYADCTSLSPGSSCSNLDAGGNASYAFNMYYQTLNQQKNTCNFNNLSVITHTDPSKDGCKFEIMIDVGRHELRPPPTSSSTSLRQLPLMSVLSVLLWSSIAVLHGMCRVL